MSGFVVAAFLGLFLIAVAFVLAKFQNEPMAEDQPDQAYSVFTRDHDLVCAAKNASEELSNRAVRFGAPAGFSGASLTDRFQQAHVRLEDRRLDRPTWSPCIEWDSAVLILLDQSGSMAERMPRVASDLISAIEQLEAASVQVLLAGFTTVGWQGGRSRLDWIEAGKPAYPGRLCDLLHIVHKEFGSAIELEDLKPLLSTKSLFENVDGEALEWARDRLISFPAKRRALIIVSDGAPVDDSTLQQNGAGFLWRHLNEVGRQLESESQLSLGAIGLDHRVDELYRRSRFVEQEGASDAAILSLVEELLVTDKFSKEQE